ncbi:hypothetical protein MK407_01125 [Streptococcus sanguinis]|uniref:hypothetical protein n=1 Tax=Streptococcus sanguinis TaxID=1305 RepID=UPI001CC04CA3|nr:hypothetical protein [Streptococcus sanguinis]MBZ2024469.1 hypothetical protein [Streptococcus sanguinis]MBZ2047669.1 hypothetical protein [Streptococcus sanguinis]MBZ2051553.1 hypothetical protein [Streptococcus sanguinis]MBZ2060736.1 hypothetical protein [Streptococcus sanguinis]MCC3176344.1 hypothetical protein [Streptococcus sanguinis]
MNEVVFRQSWLKIFFLAISASALAGFLTAVLILPSKNGYLLFDSNISVIEKLFLVIGTIVFDFLSILVWICLFRDKRFLRLTAQGFYFRPLLFREVSFYSWEEIQRIDYRIKRIRHYAKYQLFNKSHILTICFHSVDPVVLKRSRLASRKSKKYKFGIPEPLEITLMLLKKEKPKYIYETMMDYHNQWRASQKDI